MKKNCKIPIEVLSVEDKVFGNLNFIQVITCFSSSCIGLLIMIIPPKWHLSFTKLSLLIIVASFSLIMIVKLHNKLIYRWLIIIARYNYTPKIYIHPQAKFLNNNAKKSKTKLSLMKGLR